MYLSFRFLLVAVLAVGLFTLNACKSCKKDKETPVVNTQDSSGTALNNMPNTLNLPHADTTMIPVLKEVLEKAFDASLQKDYNALAGYIIYRGPEEKRHGMDVFRNKGEYEKSIVRITSDVFAKWNTGLVSREYPRVFELQQPDGRPLLVMEVIFIYDKKVDRKFFGFLELPQKGYLIADVSSWI